MKYGGRHKSLCVADGHLTDTPVDSVLLGVIPLQGSHMVFFIAELNGRHFYATDIGNAYLDLEDHTAGKLWIIAPPEFGPHNVNNLLRLKDLQPIEDAVHLGCKFARDQHGVLYIWILTNILYEAKNSIIINLGINPVQIV